MKDGPISLKNNFELEGMRLEVLETTENPSKILAGKNEELLAVREIDCSVKGLKSVTPANDGVQNILKKIGFRFIC